jgi:hypothetical protein
MLHKACENCQHSDYTDADDGTIQWICTMPDDGSWSCLLKKGCDIDNY